MNDQQVRVGIDPRADWCYVARVAWSNGRPQVKALARFYRDQLADHKILRDAYVVWGVPDSRARIRGVSVTPSGNFDPHDLAVFELTQGLLDDPEEFCLAAVPLSAENQYLGLSVRHAPLSRLGAETGSADFGWQVRSAALTCGWTSFCRDHEGGLIGLIDFTSEGATVGVIYRRRIAAVAHVDCARVDLSQSTGQSRLAAELRTVVDFRLDSLSEHGISVPLSGLVLCGADLADGLAETIREFFKAPLIEPSISPGFFPQSADLSAVPLDRYLIALGLTVA